MLAACFAWSCDLLRACASSCDCLSWAVCSCCCSSLERCWIDTSLGVLLQLVSIELEIIYPWLFVLQWRVEQLLRILDIVLVLLRLPPWTSSLSLHC